MHVWYWLLKSFLSEHCQVCHLYLQCFYCRYIFSNWNTLCNSHFLVNVNNVWMNLDKYSAFILINSWKYSKRNESKMYISKINSNFENAWGCEQEHFRLVNFSWYANMRCSWSMLGKSVAVLEGHAIMYFQKWNLFL